MTTAIQPGQCTLNFCSINSIASIGFDNSVNFVVRDIKIFEDHCKPYFTAQMTIETYQHAHDAFIFPTAEVIIDMTSNSSDRSFPSAKYRERFRIFSHESSEAKDNEFTVRHIHTLSLMGQEYYNDKHNNVIQSDGTTTGTSAVQKIHSNYVQSNGGLKVVAASRGLIGSDRMPHQSMNVKPFKAINDILDKCTWAQYKTCAPVYFRNKNGHVVAPLQALLEQSPLGLNFVENQNQGNQTLKYLGTAAGYQAILSIKPLAPSGEASSGIKASEVSGLMKGISYFESKSGQFNNVGNKINSLLGNFSSVPGLQAKIQPMLREAYKGNRGGGMLFNIINEIMQHRSIAKGGPGGYAAAQEALVTALTYADKYWVSVPGQSGFKVTCGDKIRVNYQTVNNGKSRNTVRNLYVARLVHNIKFVEGEGRKPSAENAITEMYGVSWM